jgi:hypothetical protein
VTTDHATDATWATAVAFGFTCTRAASATSAHDWRRAAGTAAALHRIAVYSGHLTTAAWAYDVRRYCTTRAGVA